MVPKLREAACLPMGGTRVRASRGPFEGTLRDGEIRVAGTSGRGPSSSSHSRSGSALTRRSDGCRGQHAAVAGPVLAAATTACTAVTARQARVVSPT